MKVVWVSFWLLLSLMAFSQEIEYFYKDGCPHCKRAGHFLNELKLDNPQLKIIKHNVVSDKQARTHFFDIIKRYNIEQAAVPTFLIKGTVIVGFDGHGNTKAQLKAILQNKKALREQSISIFGQQINLQDYGLLSLTVVLGLIDGFNPCAMWVLLFLLSFLINLKDRKKIALIAGTFIVVSGVVYFAFMAAWLNIFLLLGHTRKLQIVLGTLATVVGLIHVKDFFWFKQGISLSIPEKFKPIFYNKVRIIIQSNQTFFLLLSVVSLAILVNLVEILCTAGLPAIFTQVLVSKNLSSLEHYFYMVLYNVAYMFDDSIMVIVAIVTLRKTKLQEKGGRYLKLISGSIILVMGLIFLIRPELFEWL